MYYTLSSTTFSQGYFVDQYIPMNFIRSPESCPTDCTFDEIGDNAVTCTNYADGFTPLVAIDFNPASSDYAPGSSDTDNGWMILTQQRAATI